MQATDALKIQHLNKYRNNLMLVTGEECNYQAELPCASTGHTRK